MRVQTNKYNLEMNASPAQEHLVNEAVEKLLRYDPAHLTTRKKKNIKTKNVQPNNTNSTGYKGLLLVRCNYCGKVTIVNEDNPITKFRCLFCGQNTQLLSMRTIKTNCECGKDWTHLTNLKSPNLWIRCQKCGTKTLVKWNDKMKKYVNLGM